MGWVAKQMAEKYPGLTEEQIWVLEFCGKAACEYLKEKYCKQSGNPVRVDLVSITHHKGRVGTARKLFEKRGLITPIYSTDAAPVYEKVDEICLKEGKECDFDVSGCSHDSKNTAHVSRIQSYIVLSYMNAREQMYIYAHQDEYDFCCVANKDAFGKTNTKTLKVFPKNKLPTLEANIIRARVTEYARGNVREILPKILGYTPRALHNDACDELKDSDLRSSVHSSAQCNRSDPFTEEDLTERIAVAARQIRFLRRTVRELLDLRRYIRENSENKLIEIAEDHLMYMAPILINDADEKIRSFAKALLSGTSTVESD